jgi:GMP synthase-like glutamine amidotransferase
MSSVLLISVCQEKLHQLEFVKPVADILKAKNIHFEICDNVNLCLVDELKRFDRLMQKDAPSISNVLSSCPQEFFERDEVLEYVNSFSHIIICGTSLRDCDFETCFDCFNWISDVSVPVLGICAGFQIIGTTFGGKLVDGKEIGYYFEKFESEFLGLESDQEVFHLHNNYIEFSNDFDVFATSPEGIVQAVKHKKKDIYGVLFHPEVRQKQMILEFVNGK